MLQSRNGWRSWNLHQVATAQLILSSGALRVGDFVLADGSRSSYKIDLRAKESGGPLEQSTIEALGQDLRLCAEERRLSFECVAGVPNAGGRLAEAFSRQGDPREEWPVDVFYLEKKDGNIVAILNALETDDGEEVLVIDDVATHSFRKEQAIGVLRTAGYTVTAVLVVVDREEGAREGLAKLGCTLHALFKISDILEFGRVYGTIPAEEWATVTDYLAQHRV